MERILFITPKLASTSPCQMNERRGSGCYAQGSAKVMGIHSHN
jgi:hypothetical protein